ISSVIRELYIDGRSTKLETVQKEIPRGLLELSKLDGIGDSRIRALHTGLEIASLEELEAGLDAGRVRTLKGFGIKTEQKIREAVERYRRFGDRLRLLDALEQSGRLLVHARKDPASKRVETAGELRRWRESVEAIDLVAASQDPASTAEHFTKHAEVLRVESL